MPLTLKINIHTAGGTTFAGERVLEGDCVTVGRSKECSLSLDDPEKYLSRVQAELVRSVDGYLLKATSKHSPVLLNGKALEIDSEVTVRPGDTVTMDIYDLEIVSIDEPEGDPDATYIVPEADPEATMIFGGLSRSPAAFQAGLGSRAAPPATPAAAPQIDSVQVGQVLAGRYRIEATLVASGMGTVYRAHDQSQAKDVALRVMPQELLASDQAKQRFIQEARIAIKLTHPNIVSTYDAVTEAEHVFLTMELLSGQTLRVAMEERNRVGRKWSEAEVLALIRPLCAALSYAHQFTVHRDIRPENVWLGDGGSVKLMDFGLAPGLPDDDTTRQRPATGAAAGYYMAPEQLARTNNVDHRADQYALGVMLYELLAGRMPAGRIESLGALRTDVSPGLSAAVDKALSANPADRFGSDAQFLVALRTSKEPAAPPATPGQSSGQGGRRLKLLGVGAAALAGVLVLFLQWPKVQGILPEGEAQKQLEQKISRLDGEAKALLKMIEGDQRELKEATAGANREVERIAGQLRAARTSTERASLDLALREARNTARLITALENKLRDQAEGPKGLPKAEGNLSAAATAAKGADKTGAIRLLEETVGTLTQMRASITEDRKAAQAVQQRRQEELRVAEARAIKEEEARLKAEAEARAIALAEREARARAAFAARARAESMARAKAEADARERAESEARAKLGAEAGRGTN